MAAAMPSQRRKIVPWLVAYALTIAAILLGLRAGRDRAIAALDNPASLAEWRDWAAETQRPNEPGQPVERRPVKSDEPPALILMRDHFGSVQMVSLVIGTFLFGFLGFLGHGIWSQRKLAAEGPLASDRD